MQYMTSLLLGEKQFDSVIHNKNRTARKRKYKTEQHKTSGQHKIQTIHKIAQYKKPDKSFTTGYREIRNNQLCIESYYMYNTTQYKSSYHKVPQHRKLQYKASNHKASQNKALQHKTSQYKASSHMALQYKAMQYKASIHKASHYKS